MLVYSLSQISRCSFPSRQAPGTRTGCEQVNTFERYVHLLSHAKAA